MKPSGPGLLFVDSFKIIDSISLLVIGLYIFSISSWFSSGRLYFSKSKYAICSKMDGPRDYHSNTERQRQRKTNIIYLLYVESKKIIQKILFTKQK